MALVTGLIFFAGSTISFAAASQTRASKKSSWKKPHAKKRQGWRVKKKTAGWRKQSLKKKRSKTTQS